MGWFSKRKAAAQTAKETREISDVLLDHLDAFVATRRGVEAWIEQPTSFNQSSLLLVAGDGESTRRAIPSIAFGYDFAARHDIPAYDAGVVPYPQRMREYGIRNKRR